ncbi:MAG: hydroxypyruvate isomerase family protein [Propylenella sp.]
MLRFSANLGFLWLDLLLAERIRRAKAARFDAVEFHFPYDVPAEAVRAALTETGLPAVGLNTRLGDRPGDAGLAALPGREAEARAAIDEALAYAAAIGADYVHVVAGRVGGDEREEAREAFCASLAYAADKAKPAGITIVIEPLNRYDAPGRFLRTSEEAAELIGALGRDDVKILFDCYHAQISEGDLTRRIEKLLPVIHHIQVAAVPSRREPDEGEVAYDRLLPAIDAMGYRGFISAEYRPRATVEEGLGWMHALKKLADGRAS